MNACLEHTCSRVASPRALLTDEQGTTSLEYVLLIGAIAIPSIYLFDLTVSALVAYYQMMTSLNALPFP